MLYQVFHSNDSRYFYLFVGIKGLMRDGNSLHDALRVHTPDQLSVSLSPEEVEGMKAFLDDPFEMNLSDFEIVYGLRLSVYGEIMTPSPCYIEMIKYAKENSVPIEALDLNEYDFSRAYTRHVKTFTLIRHSIRKKKIMKMDLKDTSAEDFVVKWNNEVNRIKGIGRVEKLRSEYVAESLLKENTKGKRHFAYIDLEFLDDTRDLMEKNGYTLEKVL